MKPIIEMAPGPLGPDDSVRVTVRLDAYTHSIVYSARLDIGTVLRLAVDEAFRAQARTRCDQFFSCT